VGECMWNIFHMGGIVWGISAECGEK